MVVGGPHELYGGVNIQDKQAKENEKRGSSGAGMWD